MKTKRGLAAALAFTITALAFPIITCFVAPAVLWLPWWLCAVLAMGLVFGAWNAMNRVGDNVESRINDFNAAYRVFARIGERAVPGEELTRDARWTLPAIFLEYRSLRNFERFRHSFLPLTIVGVLLDLAGAGYVAVVASGLMSHPNAGPGWANILAAMPVLSLLIPALRRVPKLDVRSEAELTQTAVDVLARLADPKRAAKIALMGLVDAGVDAGSDLVLKKLTEWVNGREPNTACTCREHCCRPERPRS